MKLTFRTPFHARGRVKGKRVEQDILVSRVSEVDVPEVGSTETALALVTSHGYDSEGMRVAGGLTLRSFKGRLYRPFPLHDGVLPRFPEAGDEPGAPLIMTAFENASFSRGHGSCLTFRSPAHHLANLAASTMTDYYHWLLRFARGRAGNCSRWVEAWPHPRNAFPHWQGSRDDRTVDDVMPYVKDINAKDVELADGMTNRQLGKLLFIDGSLHYASAPPCIAVSKGLFPLYEEGYHDAHIRLATMPESLCKDLRTRYFPLSNLDEAREYAARLAGPCARRAEAVGEFLETLLQGENDGPPSFERFVEPPTAAREPEFTLRDNACDWVPDFESADFDADVSTEEDLVWRAGMSVTEALVRYIEIKPDRADLLDAAERMLIAAAKARALRYDPTTDRRENFSESLGGLVAVWRRLGRPEGHGFYNDLGSIRDARDGTALDGIIAMADYTAISIDAVGGGRSA